MTTVKFKMMLMVIIGILFLMKTPNVIGEERNELTNILVNGNLSAGNDQQVPAWSFEQNKPEGKIEKGITRDKTAQNYLFIRKEDSGTHDHTWWRQMCDVNEGQKYHLTFQSQGYGKSDYGVYAGAAFVGENGRWIGFELIKTVASRSSKYPSVNTEEVRKWKEFEGNVTPPPGTRKIILRLGLDAISPSEAYFKDIKLTTSPRTVVQVLETAPLNLPHYDISLNPVTADGITLTPDWNLQGAETSQSAARFRVSLNGLWAVQPATSNIPPRENDWGFMKVPGFLHHAKPYLIYGQERTSWSKVDVRQDGRAIWYARDVVIPFHKHRNIFLEFSGQPGFALRIYWNGKPVNILTDQNGGRVNISSFAQPGEKGQLVIYALSTPGERYAFLMESGKMARRYDSKATTSGLLDIYLCSEPEQPVFSWTQAIPSVRQNRLAIRITPAEKVSPAVFTYAVTVRTFDGQMVKEVTGMRCVTLDEMFAAIFPWSDARRWSPDDPYLYQYQIKAMDANNQIVDETLPEKFGFREIWVQGRYLMMNGQPLRLRPRLSNTMFMDSAAVRREFNALKYIGFNCVLRPTSGTTHEMEIWNLESPDGYFGTADEMGIMVIPYTPYSLISGGQFGDAGINIDNYDLLMKYIEKHQIAKLANHPSVIAFSGFGAGYQEGINYVNCRPDIWGISPLGSSDVMEKILSDAVARAKAAKTFAASRDFINGVKRLDPSRPFLSHNDGGEGDGWGIFDYFNWTPLQEWEEWPERWSRLGIKPVGSTEHGLPYPSSFLNHGIPDGDSEPWVTEYSAMILGPKAYFYEPAAYLQFIRSSYNKITGSYPTKNNAHHYFAMNAVAKNPANTQEVWAVRNKAIYRAWRTYGLPMGIEPFGHSTNLWTNDSLKAGNGQNVVQPADNLRTGGARLDRWFFNSYWPSATSPGINGADVIRSMEGLEPLGKILREVNSPLLAYIAGKPARFTAKDHVFWNGETITKQIALVWDGFHPLTLTVKWQVDISGVTVVKDEKQVTLKGGEIKMLPIAFSASTTMERAEGNIKLEVCETDKNQILACDDFAFQIYSSYKTSLAVVAKKIAIIDTSGESFNALKKIGLNPIRINNLKESNAVDLLVIGRNTIAALKDQKWTELAPDVPVLVLEQNDQSLENLGLRAFPNRIRTAFPLPISHPVLKGVGTADLSDWRVEAKLLPAGVEPLRDGYNYHTGYYGTVASVTIDTPTRGNFTPLLQCGFDLRETPLLEGILDGRRWLFCQLSVIDGLGTDPVATRLFSNLLEYMTAPVRKDVSWGVVGSMADLKLAHDLGGDVSTVIAPDNLNDVKLILVGKNAILPQKLRSWVNNGGTAILLPQELSFYQDLLPEIHVEETSSSLIVTPSLPSGSLAAGLGQNDFHYRQSLAILQFNKNGNVAEFSAGRGKFVLLGFDPRALNLKEEPYLRLSYRHQYRALSQILTNLGVSLPLPMKSIIMRFEQVPVRINITEDGKARISGMEPAHGMTWVKPEFNDSSWPEYSLKTKSTLYGHARVRIAFMAPSVLMSKEFCAELGTFDDYDECYLNGILIGSVNPGNSKPDLAFATPRFYRIPEGVLKPGRENVLAIYVWNRNAESKGWNTWIRGPMKICPAEAKISPYAGDYKHSDDPYLQRHW